MGLFKALKRSSDKTKMMKKLIKVCDVQYYDPEKGFNDNVPSQEEREMVQKEFYEYIYKDEILGAILKKHKVSYDDFDEYLNQLQGLGLGWSNGRYVPVDVFSFGRELEYFLTAMENNEDLSTICYNLNHNQF